MKTYEFIILYKYPKMRDGYKTTVLTLEMKENQDPYKTFNFFYLSGPFIKVEGGFIPVHGIYEIQVREAAAV